MYINSLNDDITEQLEFRSWMLIVDMINGRVVAVLLVLKPVPGLTVGISKTNVWSSVTMKEGNESHCRGQTTCQAQRDRVPRSLRQVLQQKVLNKRVILLNECAHFLDFFREELSESMLITSFKCSIYAKCVSYHYVMYNIVLS